MCQFLNRIGYFSNLNKFYLTLIHTKYSLFFIIIFQIHFIIFQIHKKNLIAFITHAEQLSYGIADQPDHIRIPFQKWNDIVDSFHRIIRLPLSNIAVTKHSSVSKFIAKSIIILHPPSYVLWIFQLPFLSAPVLLLLPGTLLTTATQIFSVLLFRPLQALFLRLVRFY